MRSLLLGALRLIVIPVALIWLIGRVVGSEWWQPAALSPVWLALGLLVNQSALVVFAARMRWVLLTADIGIGWLAALRIHLQSMFYFFILPMTVGMEIARFLKIRVLSPSATAPRLAGCLLLDRLLGAVSALLLALMCLPFVNLAFSINLSPALIWLCAAGAGLLVCALLLVSRVRHLLLKAWMLTREHRLRLIALLALSILMHVLFSWAVQSVGYGIGLPIAFIDTCFAVAGGMLLVAIPVSLAGLGPAEAGAAALFLSLGYQPSVAVAAGALPYFLRLAAAVEGGVWELLEGGTSALGATRRMIEQSNLPQSS